LTLAQRERMKEDARRQLNTAQRVGSSSN